MASLADRLGVAGEHELVIGASFSCHSHAQSLHSAAGTATPAKAAAATATSGYHTIRYDFKPASVDESGSGCLDVGADRSVAVSLAPGSCSSAASASASAALDAAQRTCYRGSLRQYQKECVLIVDHETGRITLERLTDNIQVKKTRNESVAAARLGIPSPRPITPIDTPPKRASPLTAGAERPSRSPRSGRSANSMPVFGLLDDTGAHKKNEVWSSTAATEGVISASESDDSDPDEPPSAPCLVPPTRPAVSTDASDRSMPSMPSMPSAHLFTDLQLSDSD